MSDLMLYVLNLQMLGSWQKILFVVAFAFFQGAGIDH